MSSRKSVSRRSFKLSNHKCPAELQVAELEYCAQVSHRIDLDLSYQFIVTNGSYDGLKVHN